MRTQQSHIHYWQRLGGWAALLEAVTYIFGFILLALVFAPAYQVDTAASDRLQFLLAHEQVYRFWLMVIYLLFGITLVPLVSAIHQLSPRKRHPLQQCGTIFGYTWVVLVIASGMIGQLGLEAAGRLYAQDTRQAGLLWATLEAVQDGLGGGVEIVGGLWVLLISIVAWRGRQLNRFINGIGLLVGLSGVLTVIPGCGGLGTVFGSLQIVWFFSLGIHLLRK